MASTPSARTDPFVRLMLFLSLVGLVGIVLGVYQRVFSPTPLEYHAGSTLPPQDGPELVAVYIGSSDCRGSKLPGFADVERRTMDALARFAAGRAMRFVRIGVSVDASPVVGQKYLEQFGPFDGLEVGRGWMNPAAIRYLWREFPANSAIPQIVVIKRDVHIAPTGVVVGPDSLMGRLVGISGMQDWLARNGG